MNPRPLFAALLLALSVPAAADRILILGDSHTVGPFGATLDARLRAKGHDTALQAVCGASISWWLGPTRPKLSICYALHGFGAKASAQEGAPPSLPPTADRLMENAPDVVVVALGSNPEGASAADTAAAAEKLIALMPPGARCFWVGPPPMPARQAAILEVYKALPHSLVAASRTGPACTLIDSRPLIRSTDAAPNDHFYGAPAVAWGEAVADQISP
jgi:hypothetical protein